MRTHVIALAAAALLALSSGAALAQTSPQQDGKVHFQRGVELYGEGDFHGALIEFRRTYEIDGRFQALFNVGETQFQLQDYAGALGTLEKYLKDGGAQIPTDRRAEVQKEIDKLRTRVATVEITTSAPGVDIAVDDVLVGKTPLAPLTVSAGRRKLTASAAGKPPLTQTIDLAGGDSKRIAFTISETAPAPAVKDQAPPPSKPVKIWPWAVTAGLTTGAVVTGVLALGASNDLDTKIAHVPGNASDITAAHGKVTALAVTSDVFTGAAVVMGGISIAMTVSALSSSGGDKTTALRVGPQRVELFGSF